MKILGIETSCDETALSIVECSGDLANPKFEVIDWALDSQASLHAEYGGVFPTLAKREHTKNLPILLDKILENKNLKDIEAIAVTQGPGLEPALWTGIVFAKELGEKWNIPVIPTNHMEGHIISPLIHNKNKIEFPALALLISGGHTQLVKVNSWGSYEILGETVDDAVGEAFDKVARILGLPYPGGPEISRKANKSREHRNESSFNFPRPMMHTKDFNFSFSGLKTAVLYTVKKIPHLTENIIEEVAHGFEDAVTEVLTKKTIKAIEEIGANTLIIGGGVVSNTHIRETFEKICKEKHIELLLSDKTVATDNAIMIAAAGYISYLKNPKSYDKKNDFKAEGNLKL